jgi:predicted solute-binding protein
LQAIDLQMNNSTKEELKEKLTELENLKKEIEKETKVPLSYMREYYDLIMHLELVTSKINIKIATN